MTHDMTFIITDNTPCGPASPSIEAYGECPDDGAAETLQMITFFASAASVTAGTIEADSPTATIYATAKQYRALCKCLDRLNTAGGSVHVQIWYTFDEVTGNLLVTTFRCRYRVAAVTNVQLAAIAAATLRETRELHGTMRHILAVLRHGPHAHDHGNDLDRLRRELANARGLSADGPHGHASARTSNPSPQVQTPQRNPDGN